MDKEERNSRQNVLRDMKERSVSKKFLEYKVEAFRRKTEKCLLNLNFKIFFKLIFGVLSSSRNHVLQGIEFSTLHAKQILNPFELSDSVQLCEFDF